MLGSTKIGKTQPLLMYALQSSMNRNENPKWRYSEGVDGKHFWWVGRTYGQSEIAFFRLSKILKRTGAFNIVHMRVETPMGSIINFKTADDPESLYGEDCWLIVGDEASRMKEKAWPAMYSTLTATGGQFKGIANYKGESNWFTRLYREKDGKDPEYYCRTVDAMEGIRQGLISPKVVEQARKDLHEVDFDALYLCKGSLDQYQLFDLEKIYDAYTNEYLSKHPDKKRYLIADLAYYGADKFVVHIWEGCVWVKRYEYKKSGGPEIVDRIKKIAEDWGIPRSQIAYDASGADWALGFLEGCRAIKGANKSTEPETYYNYRSELYFKLAKELRDNGFWFKEEGKKSAVIGELEHTKRIDTPNGKLRVMSKKDIKVLLKGVSPDDADTLSMRMDFVINPVKEVDEKYERINLNFTI